MGRETKILLGFLGLLAGVFVGVLSMKLLVPRPPAGAGPDIRSETTVAFSQERVEPPRLDPGGWDFGGAPPLVPDSPGVAPAEPVPDSPPRASRFAAVTSHAEPPPHEDDVTPASWQQLDAVPPTSSADAATDPAATPRPDIAADRFAPPPAEAAPPRDPFAPPASSSAASVAGAYLVQDGDSWWSLAERAYGDGRLYRALFAWNRAREPRVSLLPGTRLDVPPLDQLQAAWPRLTSPSAPR